LLLFYWRFEQKIQKELLAKIINLAEGQKPRPFSETLAFQNTKFEGKAVILSPIL
jgi:hypothetical protein